MAHIVTEVLDGQILRIDPPWTFEGQRGDIVLATGYRPPFRGPEAEVAKAKVTKLVLNEEIEIQKPTKVIRGRLLCDVYVKGRNLRGFMVEYQ